MRGRVAHRAGVLAAFAYLIAVLAFELLRRGPAPDAADLASSPAGVASGHLWSLLTSGLVVAGDPALQIAGAAIAAAGVLAVLGPGAFWRAALAGHIGATLVAYAGVGVLWLVSRADVDTLVDAPDYGISCVWAGSLGALVAAGLRGPRRRCARAVAAVAVLLLLAALPFSSGLAGIEHALAFLLGGAFAVGLRRRGAGLGTGDGQAVSASADATATGPAPGSRGSWPSAHMAASAVRGRLPKPSKSR